MVHRLCCSTTCGIFPRTGNDPKSSSLQEDLTTGPPEKSQCLCFYLETKEQDNSSKSPSSFGMSFSVGQPGSKSILQKKKLPPYLVSRQVYICCDHLFPCVIQGHSLDSLHCDQADHSCSFQGWSTISDLWG